MTKIEVLLDGGTVRVIKADTVEEPTAVDNFYTFKKDDEVVARLRNQIVLGWEKKKDELPFSRG